MSETKSPSMIEVNTADLIGLALDWATGIADGRELELPGAVRGRTGIVWCEPFEIKLQGEVIGHDKSRRYWSPSTDWALGGPLIEKHQIDLCWDGSDGKAMWWHAYHQDIADQQTYQSPLIAVCRAIVAAKLGKVVSLPAELVPA